MSQLPRHNSSPSDVHYVPYRPQPSSLPSNGIFPRDYLGPRSDPPPRPGGDFRPAPRKPIPSPLQSTQFPLPSPQLPDEKTPKNTTFGDTGHTYSQSDVGARSRAESVHSPKSPRRPFGSLSAAEGHNLTPAEKQVAEASSPGEQSHRKESKSGRETPSSGTLFQSRKSSDSFPTPRAGESSYPDIPLAKGIIDELSQQKIMPRTSSIDSAISSISSTHSHKSSMDSIASSPADIASLISAAGSAENLIQHLLKEKQHAAHQNTQLWRLVEKQRTLILGLNKDLERTVAQKERYRKKLKEVTGGQGSAPPVPTPPMALRPEAVPEHPAHHASDSQDESAIDLPIQRHSVQVGSQMKEALASALGNHPAAKDRSFTDPTMSSSMERGEGISGKGKKHSDTIDSLQSLGSSQSEESRRPSEALSENLTNIITDREAMTSSPPNISPPYHITTSPQNSFTAKRSLPKPSDGPTATIDEMSATEKNGKVVLPFRKAPPAPLDLSQPNIVSKHLKQASNDDDGQSESEYDEISEVEEIPHFERGRRKTREEDDRLREEIALREQELRSRSKKEKRSKSKTEKLSPTTDPAAISPASPKQMVPQSPPSSAAGMLQAPGSLASVLDSNNNTTTLKHSVSAPLKSPGLPLSPRPVDRPMNSPLPRMPRPGAGVTISSPPQSPGIPTSPKALRILGQEPLMPYTPSSMMSPNPPKDESTQPSSPEEQEHLVPAPHEMNPNAEGKTTGRISPGGEIFRGLISEKYPGLLLPPTSLSSVHIKVSSSRMRPSRMSLLMDKPQDEEPVFWLGIRRKLDNVELWRVEKGALSLSQLHQTLKQSAKFTAQLPDRSLFSGHAPAKIDARRKALNRYFTDVLQTPMEERTAIMVCKYLSAGAIRPSEDDTNPDGVSLNTSSSTGTDAKPRKEGYLTKQGKKFGGWKARYFILDGPELKYYESQNGPHLGNIKLQHAQVGRKTQTTNASPSRCEDDIESDFRHAFVILEPKRKDSTAIVRHLLCAESDAERDQWVEALLKYVEHDNSSLDASRSDETIKKSNSTEKKRNHSPLNHDNSNIGKDGLVTVSYDDTVPAEAPVLGLRQDETPMAGQEAAMAALTYGSAPKSISGPTNGSVIQDLSAWGNRVPQKEKEQRKRSIWGFKSRSSGDLMTNQQHNGSTSSLTQIPEKRATVRPVFGMPLAEAVEFCGPIGVDSNLPAVVYRCIEYLEAKHAASEEGIFRLSGSNILIKSLKERFNVEGDVDLLAEETYYDVHAIASLLKLYLRELPSSVLTRELHLDFLEVLGQEQEENKVPIFNRLVHRLPQANFSILKALSTFLISIVSNSDVNKMTIRNVGIVFSPSLNIPAPLVSFFLTRFDAIFIQEPTQEEKLAVNEPVRTDEVRSPRRQIFSEIPTPSFSQDTFNRGGKLQSPMTPELRAAYDTGFTSVHPSYDQYSLASNSYHRATGSDPESSGIHRTIQGPAKSEKSKRRESSMLLMGFGMGKKNSMPKVKEDPTMVEEDSAFE
ncbi:MAG: hypothetical protein M1834_007879 [Cirrosporium novae-zelandiae]|nr:MAG: hypothetical protein M1834_007879 [Cirrosporium novae-zelandiae]